MYRMGGHVPVGIEPGARVKQMQQSLLHGKHRTASLVVAYDVSDLLCGLRRLIRVGERRSPDNLKLLNRFLLERWLANEKRQVNLGSRLEQGEMNARHLLRTSFRVARFCQRNAQQQAGQRI